MRQTYLASLLLQVLLPSLVTLVTTSHLVNFRSVIRKVRCLEYWVCSETVEIEDQEGKRRQKALKAAQFVAC